MCQLLALPDACLLAVMQCLAAAHDHCSLFKAARLHSRLHQAAVAALGSISVWGIREQEVLDSVLLYLSRHAQHVSSVSLFVKLGRAVTIHQLPCNLRLGSLRLHGFELQLWPGAGSQGVLGYDGLSALKQLRLSSCVLLDGNEGLAAALELLPPGLEHLSIDHVRLEESQRSPATFPTSILQQLQQLTHLQLLDVKLQGADQSSPALQPLQALSRLADLRLDAAGPRVAVAASMLSDASGLTRLELHGSALEPAVLAGKTQLQHLLLLRCDVRQNAAWTAQLLAQLESLQQLTYLVVAHLAQTAPPAAYSALTASSKLQVLCVSLYILPTGAWQQVFPDGRRLPHLTSLDVCYMRQSPSIYMAAPEGSRLVSCCPRLQRLAIRGFDCSTGTFSPLQGLTGLRSLTVSLTGASQVAREVCQLTGLRDLDVYAPETAGELLLHTTQLRQLTRLEYCGQYNGSRRNLSWVVKNPRHEPVWRRVLRRHLKHSDPAVAQAAAAALAAG